MNAFTRLVAGSRTSQVARLGRRFGARTVALVLCLISAATAYSADFYMATDGSDANPGTMEKPFATITQAQKAVSPGDTVFIRGGKYDVKTEQIAATVGNAVHVFDINKSGTEKAPINYFSYKDEKVVFDFSTVTPVARIYAFYVSANWIHFRGFEITGVKVTMTALSQSECFENHGSNNIYDRLKMHDGMAIGYYSLAGSNNLIINCDAWNNWDSLSGGGRGGNTDGFGSHAREPGAGNVFRYCRAWYNSDDGYDCINCAQTTTFDHCWAMYNGFNAAKQSLGDGNGFKAGGYGATRASQMPTPPRNIIQFCLAVGNKANGMYANHHTQGDDWFNNSSFGNGANYNMLERLMDNLTDVPGTHAFMRNNLGYKGRREIVSLDPKSDALNNYFNLGPDGAALTLTDADFLSIDEAQLVAPRKPDGSLPDITFMHLAKGSQLIGKGVPIKNDKGEVRFPFKGAAPDLGAFESTPSAP